VTQVVQRRTFPDVLRDHHTRIRRLEMAPAGGSDATCTRCSFVNPGDIAVDPEFLECIYLAAGQATYSISGQQLDPYCDPDPDNWPFIGYTSNWSAGFEIWVRMFGTVTYASNVSLRAAINTVDDPSTASGNGTVATYIFPAGGAQYTGPFDSGWIPSTYDPAGDICNYNWFYGCVDPYSDINPSDADVTFAWKFVWLVDGEPQTALDDFPPGDENGDIVTYDLATNEWVVASRDPVGRDMSFFMGR